MTKNEHGKDVGWEIAPDQDVSNVYEFISKRTADETYNVPLVVNEYIMDGPPTGRSYTRYFQPLLHNTSGKEGKRKMKIQEIYDLREMTGFVDGDGLHDLFQKFCGDGSPSGNGELPESFPLPPLAAMRVSEYFADSSNVEWIRARISESKWAAVRATIAAHGHETMMAASTAIRAEMEKIYTVVANVFGCIEILFQSDDLDTVVAEAKRVIDASYGCSDIYVIDMDVATKLEGQDINDVWEEVNFHAYILPR